MRLIEENRACKIIYNFIKSNNITGKALLPANVCHDVVDTLLYAGLSVQFIDISMDTYCVDEEQICQYIDDARVLLYVHTYGIEKNYTQKFNKFCELNPNLIIIDDKCLCLPCFHNNEICVDLELYSTGEKKQVDLGVGGFAYIADKWNYFDCLEGKHHILFDDNIYKYSSDLTTEIIKIKSHKEKLNKIYRESLPKEIQLPDEYQNWRFNIFVENKELILKTLFENRLFASNHYKSYISKCSNANLLHDKIINLFNDLYYTEQQAIETCEIIKKIINTNDKNTKNK